MAGSFRPAGPDRPEEQRIRIIQMLVFSVGISVAKRRRAPYTALASRGRPRVGGRRAMEGPGPAAGDEATTRGSTAYATDAGSGGGPANGPSRAPAVEQQCPHGACRAGLGERHTRRADELRRPRRRTGCHPALARSLPPANTRRAGRGRQVTL